ncbi:hypothetical protein Tco_0381967 [Tanacetum coccineum]
MNHHHRHCGLNRWSRRLTGSIGFEVEPVNYALMAISSSSSSSSSDNEVQKCSKQCLESFKTLQKNYDSEREKYSLSMTRIQGYELALESLESRILVHEKNKLAWVNMSARDNTGLGYGTQLNEMSNNSKTDSEISLSVYDVRSSDEENTPTNDRFSKADGFHAIPHLYNRETFLPQELTIFIAGVLTRTGLITHVKQNEKRAVHTVSTARPVSTVAGNNKGMFCFKEILKGALVDIGSISAAVWGITENLRECLVAVNPHKGAFGYGTNVISNFKEIYEITFQTTHLEVVLFQGGFGGLREITWIIHAQEVELVDQKGFSMSIMAWHMTGNKAYLSDYEDFNEGFVAFGSDPKGGTQDSYVAGSSREDKEPTQEYILLPLHPHRTRILVEDVAPSAYEKPSESSPKDNDVQDSKDVADKEGQHQMTEDEQVLHDNLEKMIAQEVATSINKLSIGMSSFITATTPYVSAASTPTAFDDENVGAVADFNNMDDIINVSPIPTLRIHKDHPKDQILGDPKSAVQTRGKIQKDSSAQQALNISQALQDESWVEAMQEELLQFKLQKVWILVYLTSGKKDRGNQGTIEEEVYVHQPPGFVDLAHPNKVYKVIIKLFNGLHSSPRACMRHFFFSDGNGIQERVEETTHGIFISQDKYVAHPKKLRLWSIRTAFYSYESNKHWSRFQVTLKASHLNAVKRIFRSRYCGKNASTMRQNMCQLLTVVGKVLRIHKSEDGFMFLIHDTPESIIDNVSTISVNKNPVAHFRS